MSSVTLSGMLDKLEQGELVLLPHARAARQMRVAFHARQRRRGLTAWEPARVLSWEQWTRSLWNDLILAGAESRLLLNAAQERLLWQQVMDADAAARSAGSIDGLAELAASAWRLAGEYNATEQLRRFAGSHDSRIFANWAGAFAARCRESEVLSASLLDAALEEHVRTGALDVPAVLELAGFAELEPSQRRLLDTLQERGTEIRSLALAGGDADDAVRISTTAPTEREEMLLAVRWIRRFLKSHQEKDASASVALLLANPAEKQAELEGVLREVLAPELQAVGADLSSTPWEFSGGTALASVAMVADALAIVRWTQGPLHRERVSSLLRSPYVGRAMQETAREAVARFDAGVLRRMPLLRPEIELAEVATVVPQDSVATAGLEWVGEVRAFLQRQGEVQRPRSYAEWMEFVRGVLRAANWPGHRGLNAMEFETKRAWESVLDTVSTLDFSGRRVPLASALQAMTLHANEAVLTMPATDAPVRVMSVVEAEGSFFDAVVMMGATDMSWPAMEKVHPLLPWSLQRSLQMPGSDSALGAARNRARLDAVMGAASAVLCTRAREDENGVLRASPLLSALGLLEVLAEDLSLDEAAAMEVRCETVADAQQLPALPAREVEGGSSVLKLQAACGFQAFAELRLRARAPESGDLGLDAGERGNLLHRALQTFWRETKTQEALKQMSDAEREAAARRAVDAAFAVRKEPRGAWDRAYLGVEKQRLRLMLLQWLPHELSRGPFEVLEVERTERMEIGPLLLDVRVDRVDAVEGGVFFVDYKTGFDVGVKQWEGPRPDDPQLPLYALLPEGDELKGVAFARLRAGRAMQWVGYQSEEGILPAAKSNVRDMASLAEEWRGTLETLAVDFAEGRALVDPKSFDKNCERCAQRILCRVDKAALMETEDDGAEEGEDSVG